MRETVPLEQLMENRLMNVDDRADMVGKKGNSSVWESTPHWTYARSDRNPSGGGVGEDFDPRSVKDTLYGRLCGLANRIKRHLPWRFLS